MYEWGKEESGITDTYIHTDQLDGSPILRKTSSLVNSSLPPTPSSRVSVNTDLSSGLSLKFM